MDGLEGGGQAGDDGAKHGDDFTEVAGQQKQNRFLDVLVDVAPFARSLFNSGKIVIRQNHIRRALGDVGTRDAHGDADVSRLERGRIVDAVAGHGDDIAQRTQG